MNVCERTTIQSKKSRYIIVVSFKKIDNDKVCGIAFLRSYINGEKHDQKKLV